MDTQGRKERGGRVERQRARIIPHQVWQEGQSQSTSQGRGRHTAEATPQGELPCSHGVNQRPSEGREGQTYQTEEIINSMGSLW